jgi:hypothetical protein
MQQLTDSHMKVRLYKGYQPDTMHAAGYIYGFKAINGVQMHSSPIYINMYIKDEPRRRCITELTAANIHAVMATFICDQYLHYKVRIQKNQNLGLYAARVRPTMSVASLTEGFVCLGSTIA